MDDTDTTATPAPEPVPEPIPEPPLEPTITPLGSLELLREDLIQQRTAFPPLHASHKRLTSLIVNLDAAIREREKTAT